MFGKVLKNISQKHTLAFKHQSHKMVKHSIRRLLLWPNSEVVHNGLTQEAIYLLEQRIGII